MRTDASPRIRPITWLFMSVLALALSGCFQNAGDAIAPTPVGLTAIATLRAETPTPFVTPISTGGFVPPTDNPSSPNGSLNPFVTPTQILPTNIPEQPSVTPNVTVPTVVQPPPPTVIPDNSQASQPQPPPPTTVPAISNTVLAPTAIPPTAPGLLATPTALPTEGPCVHTVQPGEWLNKIARQFNIPLEDLKAANPSFAGRYDSLQPGDVLKIPNCNQQGQPQSGAAANAAAGAPAAQTPLAPTTRAPAVQEPTLPPTPITAGRTYAVAPGDTLGGIARKFGTTVQAIKELNGLSSDALNVGDVLKIPKSQ